MSAPERENEQRMTTADLAGVQAGDDDFDDAEGKEETASFDDRSEALEPLLPADQSERFGRRWQEIQGQFVDEPRKAVEDADALVADLMQRIASGFTKEREQLEAQWDSGDDVSTEDLRVALTYYRSFFERLLAA
jgi:cytochrome c556